MSIVDLFFFGVLVLGVFFLAFMVTLLLGPYWCEDRIKKLLQWLSNDPALITDEITQRILKSLREAPDDWTVSGCRLQHMKGPFTVNIDGSTMFTGDTTVNFRGREIVAVSAVARAAWRTAVLRSMDKVKLGV
jgi:hypothetical protein